MSINKTYAIFGLGRYGISVATELVNNGAEVIAVDSDESVVNTVATLLPFCKCADTTDVEVLKRLGISNVDVVIVAMAGNIEASVMTVMLCKELGVPLVIAKCSSEMHYKILVKVGADKVVFPEKDSGIRMARNLLSSGFVDMISLSDEVSMIELDVKKDWVGKSLIELKFRKKYELNIIAIRDNEEININVDPNIPLKNSMKLIVVGNKQKLRKIK
ncbi:MAG: TrkA family potassium uptake protein [Bacilli bacterium]|nr:TrkA family potassium uptake protein [Bacilli bacterium]